MIVPMKKTTILVPAGDAEATVSTLQQLGVMHIEHQNPPEDQDIAVLEEQAALIDAAAGVLNTVPGPERAGVPQRTIDGGLAATADRIIGLGRQREALEASERSLRSRIAEWEPWGDIDAARVRSLQQNDICLKLYRVPVKELDRFPPGVIVRVLATTGDIANCVAISRHTSDCPFPEVPAPEEGLSALRERLFKTISDLENAQRGIRESWGFSEDLARQKAGFEKAIEFRKVLSGMGREGGIVYVTGYIPCDLEWQLVREARSRSWGIATADPAADDLVPTLLRNPPWADRIRPVFDLLGITPGYHELDISMLFLIFFCIFFGMLIGDAGYGLAYILITFVLQRVLKPDQKNAIMFSLFYLLGLFAVLWGILTGTFFGQTWLQAYGIVPLVPGLNDPAVMQAFCFFLGALHLSIAHAWQAYLKLPSLTALADAGWICVLWAAFFLANMLILGEAFPTFGVWLIAAGIVLVILFTSPRYSMPRRIGNGLATVALSLMNNITDVISYVRLFAVGLATLAIAETTNTLASGFGDGIAAIAAGVVILFIGHSLNIVLGPMSVLVHGVRLNVLEFSGHANVTWSGFTYEPFRK